MNTNKINDFQIGDKVIHKSNDDCLMVVFDLDIENNNIFCEWIDKLGHSQAQSFDFRVLEKTL